MKNNVNLIMMAIMTIIITTCSQIEAQQIDKSTLENELIFSKGSKITNNKFTGTAWLNFMVEDDTSYNVQIGNVTFEPGARTNWHFHPGGQILLVTNGKGLYQEKGKPVRTIQKGDIVKCLPNVIHWHGATSDDSLVHIAISTNTDKGSVVWLGNVSDEDYFLKPQ